MVATTSRGNAVRQHQDDRQRDQIVEALGIEGDFRLGRGFHHHHALSLRLASMRVVSMAVSAAL